MSTRIITPISWHSPPKCLHARPWPNSWQTFVSARVIARKIALVGLKKLWKLGSFERKTSNSTVTSASAVSAMTMVRANIVREKHQRSLG